VTDRPVAAVIGRFSLDDVRNKQMLRSLEALGYQTIVVNPAGAYLVRSRRQLRATRGRRLDLIVVPFLGYSSVPVAWAIGRLRRAPVIFDAFILLHDTLVIDRRVVPPRSLRSAWLRTLETLSCRLADVVLVDTAQHLQRFAQQTRVSARRFAVVPVGSEHTAPCDGPPSATAEPPTGAPSPVRVVYCGSFIPLHGLEHVVHAAASLRDRPEITFTFIGGGQLEGSIRSLAEELRCERCDFRGPLEGAHLRAILCEATVLLGVFGTSAKAQVVVPNKVVDGLALGRPVLTASTPAIEAVLTSEEYLGCPPGDPSALAAAVVAVADGAHDLDAVGRAGHLAYQRLFSDGAIAEALGQALARVDRQVR
jgi:glycosyltransferase involved in cell wall biosynthesis